MNFEIRPAMATRGNGHVEPTRPPDQPPKPCRGLMAEHCTRAAGENGGQAESLSGRRAVADRVCATVEQMQAAAPDRPTDRRRGVAELLELWMRHHSVLPRRERRQLPLRSYFVSHSGIKYDLNGNRPRGNVCSPG